MMSKRRSAIDTPAVTLIDFWNTRNAGNPSLLDQYSIHNLSFAVAFLAHQLRLTPNQLSVLSGVFSAAAFGLALVLPSADLSSSLPWLFGLAQFAYILDCADGQLARTTNRESEFGAFLDKGMDIASAFLAFGSVFALAYRHYAALNDLSTTNWILFIGFVFLLARSARFFVWQKFVDSYHDQEITISKLPRGVHHLLASLIDHQTSLAVILMFLVSPNLALLLFGVQASILLAVYVRYFFRAYRIERSKTQATRGGTE